MAESKFVYVTYIRSTPAKVWEALTKPEFTQQYWFGVHHECEWKVGASWKMVFKDGTTGDSGEVLEIQPEKRLVLSWRSEWKPEFAAEGWSRMSWDIEQEGDTVKLTVEHTVPVAESKLIHAVSGGWPAILSSLKSLLETGTPLPA